MFNLIGASLFDPTKLAISGGALLVVLGFLLIYLSIVSKVRQKRKEKMQTTATTVQSDDVAATVENKPVDSIPVAATQPVVTLQPRRKVTVEEARTKVTDEYAKQHVVTVVTAPVMQQKLATGGKKAVVNIDTISANFADGDVVDIAALKAKGLVGKKDTQVKILARGYIDKSLTVVADDFSVDAVKMILLADGTAKRV